MLNRRLTLVSAIVAATVLLGACASPPTSYPVPPGVRLVDAQRLSTMIEVSPPITGRTATGTMKVAVTVRNATAGRLVIEGRALFRTGPSAEPASGWKRVFIQKDSAETLEFSSLSERTSDFMVELREGNR